MTVADLMQDVRNHILARYLAGERPENLTRETPLITGGILDSLATLDLVSLIEDRMGIEFQAHELTREDFDTLAALERLVERKMSAAP